MHAHSGMRERPTMTIIIAFGILILAGIVIVCFAAYMIKAESFEVSTAILKLISFSIKIHSPAPRPLDSPAVASRGRDPDLKRKSGRSG
jgi:hypothetical protein